MVLDVGHGNCAIAMADSWTLMVDAAPSAAVMETIEQLQLKKIDSVVISHRDADHARGLNPLLAAPDLEIGSIYISADAAKDPSAPDTAMLLAALSDAKSSGRCIVSRDLDAALPAGALSGGGFEVEVLAPTFQTGMTGSGGKNEQGRALTSNSVSAVLRITLPDGLKVLLPGDMDDVALAELRAAHVDLAADVLVFPHHGSLSSVSDEEKFAREVAEAVRPHTILFSVGRGKRPRPTEDVLRGVFSVDEEIYIACTQLSSGCLSSDSQLPGRSDFGHLSVIPAAGIAGCKACAGSMTLQGGGLIQPTPGDHQAFLQSVTESAMCERLRTAN